MRECGSCRQRAVHTKVKLLHAIAASRTHFTLFDAKLSWKTRRFLVPMISARVILPRCRHRSVERCRTAEVTLSLISCRWRDRFQIRYCSGFSSIRSRSSQTSSCQQIIARTSCRADAAVCAPNDAGAKIQSRC